MAGFKSLKLGSDTKMFDDLVSCVCLTYTIKKNLGPEVFEDVLRGGGGEQGPGVGGAGMCWRCHWHLISRTSDAGFPIIQETGCHKQRIVLL